MKVIRIPRNAATFGGATPSGRAYDRPNPTGVKVSFEIEDDRWQQLNNPYPLPPSFPEIFAKLDFSDASPFMTLVDNNDHGNKDRFVDSAGGQTYANELVEDHLTGLDWIRVPKSSDTWANLIATARAATDAGHSDWRMPNASENISIEDGSLTSVRNYAPFSTTAQFPSSTTRPNNTTQFIYGTSAYWGTAFIAKSSPFTMLLCRTRA